MQCERSPCSVSGFVSSIDIWLFVSGSGGLAAGELAALGLGVVLVVLILLLLSLYWKKRYK